MLKKISFIKIDGTAFELTGYLRLSYSGHYAIIQELKKRLDKKGDEILTPFQDYFFEIKNLLKITYEKND